MSSGLNQSFNMDKKSRELVMGKLYFKNKDYKMAEKSLLEYLNSSPEDFQALKLLAQVYEYIKDNSKAFDLYERCYLAQPERKGVLLDICRLLLLNDSRLDHVDQRKWLKLALPVFPSNPIVMNLRDTLPINDYDPTPNKVTIENEIIDKLDRMEQRLVSIENMVADLVKQISIADTLKTVNLSDTSKHIHQSVPETPKTNSHVPAPQAIIKSSPSVPQAVTPTPAPPQAGSIFAPALQAPVSFSPSLQGLNLGQSSTPFGVAKQPASDKPILSTPQLNIKPASVQPASPAQLSQPLLFAPLASQVQNQAIDFTQPPPKAETPAPASTFGFSSGGLLSGVGGLKSSIGGGGGSGSLFQPTGNLFAQSTSLSSGGLFSSGSFSLSGTAKQEDKNVAVSGTNAPEQSNDLSSTLPTTGSAFGFAACSGSGNLFSDSLKKYNLPAVGSWTSEQPKKEEDKEEEDGGDDGDNEVVNSPELPIENTCEMKPIEIKSGEEDEDIVFEYRCKLFRFRDKEYKERGIGNIKVLKHRTTGVGRLIMRRDLINLVCLNCWSCSKIERMSDTRVRFAGLDASDGEPEMSVFLVKFKTQEMNDKFITQITELFPDDS